MNSPYENIDCEVMAALIYLVLIFIQATLFEFKDQKSRTFFVMCGCGLFNSLAQISYSFIITNCSFPGAIMTFYLLRAGYDIITAFMAWAFTYYLYCLVDGDVVLSIWGTIDGLLFASLCIINIINSIHPGIMYALDEAGNYSEGALDFWEYMPSCVIFATGIGYLIKHRSAISRRVLLYHMTFLVLPVAALFEELFTRVNTGRAILMVPFGSAIACLVVFMSIESPDFERLMKAKEDLRLSTEIEKKAKEEARNSASSKARFLANMTHEIRTPINAIVGLNDLILSETKEDGSFEYALKIRQSASRLLRTVNDILDYSKIESGKLVITENEYNLAELIMGCYTSIAPGIKEKGLDFKIRVDEEIPKYLKGDNLRLGQILMNLLSNASKFTDTGSVNLTISELSCEENSINLEFVVTDTGSGIREDELEYIFDSFHIKSDKCLYETEGSGLGLSITKALLNAMGSEIKVQSIYGEGSVFSFVLKQEILYPEPIGKIDDYLQARTMSLQNREEQFSFAGRKVLVVDDTDLNLFVMDKILKSLDFEVTTAPSGSACLSLAKANKYDIILLDYLMPQMNGLETKEELDKLENAKNVPVVALTASISDETRKLFLEKGFADFLTKPVAQDKLMEVLDKLLNK